MKKIQKTGLFFFIMLILGCVFTVAYFAFLGNSNQVYTDAITDYLASFSSNKSIEKNLIYILSLGGIILYSIHYLWIRKDHALPPLTEHNYKWILLAFIALLLPNYIVNGNFDGSLFLILITLLVIALMRRDLLPKAFVAFVFIIYAMYGLFFVRGMFEKTISTNNMLMVAIAGIITLCAVVSARGDTVITKLGLVAQIIAPLSLLIFFKHQYQYGDEVIELHTPLKIQTVIIALIIFCVADSVRMLILRWKQNADPESMISIGACIAISVFNTFLSQGAIMPTDMHHPYENIIGFSQVFERGQSLFDQYIPISGMYSIVHGAIFDFFGHGEVGYYNISSEMLSIISAIMLYALIWKQLNHVYVLMLSLLVINQGNRTFFVIPCLLLLVMPKIIEKRNTWLIIWFLSSLINGLNYPIFGAALCIGFAPLGIYQFIQWVKEGELKKGLRKPIFWLEWIFCLVLLIACFPYLKGTYVHVSAMGSETLYINGMSRFAQLVPSNFCLVFSEHPFIRMASYLCVSFMTLAAFVWIAYAVALHVLNAKIENRKITCDNLQGFLAMLCVVIAPLIAFSSTIVRSDFNILFARSDAVIIIWAILLIVLLVRYINNTHALIGVALFVLGFLSINNSISFSTVDTKLSNYYIVPEGYVQVANDQVEKLGTGFMDEYTYNMIENGYAQSRGYDLSQSYMAYPNLYGYYYLYDINGAATLELAEQVRGYDATVEAVNVARTNNVIIGTTFTPWDSYYLYYYLLTSGEYVYNCDQNLFYPNTSYSLDEVCTINKAVDMIWEGIDLGKLPASYGRSHESLQNIMSPALLNTSIANGGISGVTLSFEESIDGNAVDYVYLEFDGLPSDISYSVYDSNGEYIMDNPGLEKCLMLQTINRGLRLQLIYQDDNGESHSMICDISDGKLLIPLGYGKQWLLNSHSGIQLIAYMNGEQIEVPQIANVEFLKIRSIQ